MRLAYLTQAEAQVAADRIHSDLIATMPDYALSVADGHTLRWDIPHQDLDANGTPIGTAWYVVVDARCMGVLTAAEITAIFKNFYVF